MTGNKVVWVPSCHKWTRDNNGEYVYLVYEQCGCGDRDLVAVCDSPGSANEYVDGKVDSTPWGHKIAVRRRFRIRRIKFVRSVVATTAATSSQ